MTRDEARGQAALDTLDQYVAPQIIWIGSAAEELYAAEDKRSKYIQSCATEWSKIAEVDKGMFWKQAVPQALHDMLEAFQTECGIVAAEAFLTRHGWKVERPAKIT